MGSLDRQPDQAPVAVVGKPGEQQWQMEGRLAGLSDSDTGYVAPTYNYTGRRGGVRMNNPNARAMPGRGGNSALLQQRLDDTQSRFDDRYALQQQEQALKERDSDLHERIHAHSIADAQALTDQSSGFLNSIDKISQDPSSPRGSKAFLTKVLAVASQYPAAINKNPRLAQMVENYDRDFKQINGNPDSVYMLSELGQADLKDPNTLDYLRTLPGKYAGAVNDKGAMSVFNETMKAAYQANPQAKPPDGTELVRQTITGPGGAITVQPTAINEQKQAALQAKAMQAQLGQAQRTYDSAMAIWVKMKDKEGSDPGTLKMLNAHVREAKTNLDGIKGQLAQPAAQGDQPATDATAAPAAPAVNVPDAAIQHLQENPDLADAFEAKYGKGSSQQFLQRRE